MNLYSRWVQLAAMRWLKQYKGKWIPANETQNLINIHSEHKQKIPAIKYGDIWIGVTAPVFCKWTLVPFEKPDETPFTEVGREIYFNRTKKKRRAARLDEVLNLKLSEHIAERKKAKSYNFEYFMNQAYALNRDNLKCKVCGRWLYSGKIVAHRINPHLPLNKRNKVSNLASMHCECQALINNPNIDIDKLDSKTRKQVEQFRKRLVKQHAKSTV